MVLGESGSAGEKVVLGSAGGKGEEVVEGRIKF